MERSGGVTINPDTSFVMDRDTYMTMVGQIEKSENEKKRVLGELFDCKRHLKELQAARGGRITEVGKLERTNRQLISENEELRNLCCFLDDTRQKNKQVTLEWQSFGKYTAAVLKNEVETYEYKLKVLQEKLDKSVQENAELREMCLYLDQSRSPGGGSGEVKLPHTTVQKFSVHTFCAPELNKHSGPLPCYTGVTSQSTLKDESMQKRTLDGIHAAEPETAVAELEKRIGRLEAEKLELVKSLSAAHLLAAHTPSQQPADQPTNHSVFSPVATLNDEDKLEMPPHLQTLLRLKIPQQALTEEQSREKLSPEKREASKRNGDVAPEVISNAVTLLDMCRRLDAMEANGFPDGLEEAEVAALRVMVDIAWQRIQEQISSCEGNS